MYGILYGVSWFGVGVQWNLLIRTLEDMDTCIIWTPSYGPK